MQDWPHSPLHRFSVEGAYIITAATYRKELLFAGPERLTLLRDSLFELATKYGWLLQPTHHGVATDATNYAWCSASWFARKAGAAFNERITRLKIDAVRVPDDF